MRTSRRQRRACRRRRKSGVGAAAELRDPYRHRRRSAETGDSQSSGSRLERRAQLGLSRCGTQTFILRRFRLTVGAYTHLFDVEGGMRGIIGLLFYSVVALGPILAVVFIASRLLLSRDRLIGLAALAVVIGFLAGGVVGWAFVPAQWTASFWTTVEAAGNAAKYGESFEHTAERAPPLPLLLRPAGCGRVRRCRVGCRLAGPSLCAAASIASSRPTPDVPRIKATTPVGDEPLLHSRARKVVPRGALVGLERVAAADVLGPRACVADNRGSIRRFSPHAFSSLSHDFRPAARSDCVS